MTLTTPNLFCDTVQGPEALRDIRSLSAISTSEVVHPMIRPMFGGWLYGIYT